MNLILLGPPGCGKGTQSEKLSQKYKLFHLSTGDQLRHQIKLGTELGLQINSYLSKGELVPDELMIGVIEKVVSSLPNGQSILLDGFPRTILQAVALDKILTINGVLSIEIDDRTLIERISGRLIGEDGKTYHKHFAPPPIGIKTTQRNDDSEQVVQQRLQIYKNQTAPLVDFYRNRQMLYVVPGVKTIAEVEKLIDEIIQSLTKNSSKTV